MKRVVDVLYGLQGYPNAARFTDFKTDLFANGDTPAITIDQDETTALTISGANTTAILISGAAASGISLTGAMTTGIELTGAMTTGISITASVTGISVLNAGAMTNFLKFNTFAGCLSYADVDPKDIPSTGGLGADGCIQIDVGGSDYFIPIFMITLS